jgi:hypothetical protein
MLLRMLGPRIDAANRETGPAHDGPVFAELLTMRRLLSQNPGTKKSALSSPRPARRATI